jgi:hypothetical protein
MKRAIFCLLVIALIGITGTVTAAPNTPLWATEVNPTQCDKVGSPIINVHHDVVNDTDSGLGGYWAFDTYSRHIQVWATGSNDTYCAVVSYHGRFDAQAGQNSPGNTGVLDGDEDGTMQGGYRATIVGDLLAAPLWPTNGNAGSFDYMCELPHTCPGAVNWVDQYFAEGWSFTYNWWGWTYRAGRHGVWVNSSDDNSGDIN